MEVALCGLGMLFLAPLFLVIAILLKLSSNGPVFFKQRRLGQYGRPFDLIKFRSMVHCPLDQGPLVTANGDQRVTRLGLILRRTKIDELPQLWNVLRGDMSLVGPRPEVPRYVERYPDLFKLVLQQRPGITDICTVQLRNEELLLAQSNDPEKYYVEQLLPRKLAASIREGWRRNFLRDLRVLMATVAPFLHWLSPLPDFRPLADLYTMPEGQLTTMAAASGGDLSLDEDLNELPRAANAHFGA